MHLNVDTNHPYLFNTRIRNQTWSELVIIIEWRLKKLRKGGRGSLLNSLIGVKCVVFVARRTTTK